MRTSRTAKTANSLQRATSGNRAANTTGTDMELAGDSFGRSNNNFGAAAKTPREFGAGASARQILTGEPLGSDFDRDTIGAAEQSEIVQMRD